MKDKNLPDDIKKKSLLELTRLAKRLTENLENKKDLQASIIEYQKLLSLNNFIQKKFQSISKEISLETKNKIDEILKDEK